MALPPRPVPIPTPHAALALLPSMAPCGLVGPGVLLSLPACAVDPEPALEAVERLRPHVAKESTETSVGDGDVRTSGDGALKAVAATVGRLEATQVSWVDSFPAQRRRSVARSCRISGRDRRAICLVGLRSDVCRKRSTGRSR